jgi:hypothetical protein
VRGERKKVSGEWRARSGKQKARGRKRGEELKVEELKETKKVPSKLGVNGARPRAENWKSRMSPVFRFAQVSTVVE